MRTSFFTLILNNSGSILPEMDNLVGAYDDRSALWQGTAGTTPATATDVIGRIDDLSSGGAHFTQGTTSLKPIVTSGRADFDGTDDYMSANSLATHAEDNGALTIYLAFLPTFTASADRRFISFGRASTVTPIISLGQSTSNKYRILYRSDTSNLTNVSSSGDTTDDLQLITLLSDTSLKIRKNGTQIIDASFPAGDCTLDLFTIGVHRTSSILGWTDMDLYGLYFYNTSHDASQLSTMETYIMSRFGIS